MIVYDSYIYFVVFVKLIYSICYFTHLYFYYLDKQNLNGNIDTYAVYFRDICEVIFIAGMSGLMLFLFNPFYLINHELYLNEHTQYLFFAFAIILVFIAYQMVLDNFKPFPTGIIMTSIRRILTPTPTSKKDL